MKTVDQYLAAYRDTVQQAVPDEQVLAVGILSRPGSLMTAGIFKVNTIAALVRDNVAKKAAASLPQNVVVAITPTRVLFFDFRPRLQSIVLKSLVRTLPREGLRIRLEPGTMATRVVFTNSDGTCIHLDSNRNLGQYQRLNEPFIATLV